MTLPEKGWKGYGAPGWHLPGLSTRIIHPHVAFPNPEGRALHEMHAAVAEHQISRVEVTPALTAELSRIGAKR